MYTINRCVVIVKPKQPFVDWSNQLPYDGYKTTLEELNKTEHTAYLIRDVDDDNHIKREIEKNWRFIFENELFGWCTDEEAWPKRLTKKMFWEWFSMEFYSVLIDTVNQPIKRENA